MDGFGQSAGGMLRVVCLECEKQPLAYCGFCGLPVHEGLFYKISDRLHECLDCHEQMQGIIRKNQVLRMRKQIIQVTRNTTNMSEHLIGDLRKEQIRLEISKEEVLEREKEAWEQAKSNC